MVQECLDGASSSPSPPPPDYAHKTILARGCDPVMAERSKSFLPPLLGNCVIESCTDDIAFFNKLDTKKYDVIFFAPGACRWSAAKRPIPGGNDLTKGWGMDEYKKLVRDKQGEDCVIVETTEEKYIVPLLTKALMGAK